MSESIQMWVDDAAKEIWDFVKRNQQEQKGWPESVIPNLTEIIARHAKRTTSYSASTPGWLKNEAGE